MPRSKRERIWGDAVRCPGCKQVKLFIHFHKHVGRKFNITDYCKECRNIKMVTKRHNITPKSLKDMFLKQNNCCAICNKSKDLFEKGLAVDHCHKTGKIRGLLCANCNTSIGGFMDSIELLKNAIKYLQENNK